MEQALSAKPEEQEAVAGQVRVKRTLPAQEDFVFAPVAVKNYLMYRVSHAAMLLAHNAVLEWLVKPDYILVA
jgi:hypothetical protein